MYLKSSRFFLFTIFLFAFSCPLFSNEDSSCECDDSCQYYKAQGHRILLGPEVYHVNRHREGGTKQPGWLFGGRFIYDYVKRYSFYWGAEASYARGTLHGHAGTGSKLESRLSDASLEARFGYTFQCKTWRKPSFTPFIGVGHIWETNNFINPSPLHIHFKINYRYATAGFLSSICVTSRFEVGFNLKVRYMIDPECHISHDPKHKSISLNIENDHLQYRYELPLTYYFDPCGQFAFTAIPFYENRFYGRLANFPFDFLKTRFYNYGATFALDYHF